MKEKISIRLNVSVLKKEVINYLFETMTKYLDIVDMQLGVRKRIRKYNKKSLIKYLNSDIYSDKEVSFGVSGDSSYFDRLKINKEGDLIYYSIYISISKEVFEENKGNILKNVEDIFIELKGVNGYIVSRIETVLENVEQPSSYERNGGDLKDVKIKKSPSNSEEMIIVK